MATQSPQIAAAVQAAVMAIESTAAKNTNNIASKSVDDAKPELTAAITKAIAADPKVQFSTNTEPWWTKRSRWSAIIGPASMFIGIALKLSGVSYSFGFAEQGLLADGLTAFGTLVAGYLALRAGIATTPLGTPAPANPVTYRG